RDYALKANTNIKPFTIPKTNDNIVPTRTYSLSLRTDSSDLSLEKRRIDLAATKSPCAVYLFNITNAIVSNLSQYPIVIPIRSVFVFFSTDKIYRIILMKNALSKKSKIITKIK